MFQTPNPKMPLFVVEKSNYFLHYVKNDFRTNEQGFYFASLYMNFELGQFYVKLSSKA